MTRKGQNRKVLKRIAEVIGLLLEACENKTCVTKVKLMKLLYLLDLHFSKKYKKTPSFTGATYIKYFYGPYSFDVEEAVNLLKDLGFIQEQLQINFSGEPYYIYTLKNLPPDFGELTAEHKLEVFNFFKKYSKLNYREARDKAYTTSEFKKAKFGEAIDLYKSIETSETL